MLGMPLVHLEAVTYVNVICSLAENGYFHPDAPPIDSALELGYSCASGPRLLDDLLAEMADDFIEIPLSLAKKLHNAFADGFPGSKLEKTTSLSPLQIATQPARKDELVLHRVVVDQATGHCAVTGIDLRLISLREDEKEKLKDAVLEMARPRNVQFRETLSYKKKSAKKGADEELLGFIRWLDERSGDPFTAIVDGANVGYNLQNFEDGRFSFHQIQFIVETLEKMGENVLVVLPHKYTRKYYYATIGSGKKLTLSKEEKEIRDGLINTGKVYVVQPGCLDDYYWILASVSKQTKSRGERDLHIEAGDERGRWPGARPILISNDQMKDHRLEMLEPKLFRRWYSNFIVNYSFTGFIGGYCPDGEIGFKAADFFSREIQGNQDSSGNMVWHIPIADSDDEWLCVRVPTSIA